jgi:hypothetical protein
MTEPNNTARHRRRLSDNILMAFHSACDQSDFEVASHLLGVVENMRARGSVGPLGDIRSNRSAIVAAHERLWHLKHPSA